MMVGVPIVRIYVCECSYYTVNCVKGSSELCIIIMSKHPTKVEVGGLHASSPSPSLYILFMLLSPRFVPTIDMMMDGCEGPEEGVHNTSTSAEPGKFHSCFK